jgi:hypothetical protein
LPMGLDLIAEYFAGFLFGYGLPGPFHEGVDGGLVSPGVGLDCPA